MAKITTSGQLRDFLCSMINGVANGTFDSDKARNVTKLASQVNESFYSEIKIAKVMTDAGKEVSSLGNLPIAGGDHE
jgi:hypothetical protein